MVGLEASTHARGESRLRTHILPAFGNRQLITIDYADCQAWVDELSTRRAPATVVKAAQIMGKVMKAAVRGKRIPHNPMTDISLPTVTDPDDSSERLSGSAATRVRESANCWLSGGVMSTAPPSPRPGDGQ